MSAETVETKLLKKEKAAFDRLLPKLMSMHAGKYVPIKAGKPRGYFKSFDEAYAFALKKFGVDAIFLIEKVAPVKPTITSPAWEAGVMFSEPLIK